MAKSILIIEDDQNLGDILAAKLRREGYDISVIADGAQGLKAIADIKPDLVLLDIVLPTMSGYEILEKKHNDPAIRAIPVIIISNSGQPVEIRRTLALGVCDYLVKAQLDPADVIAKVRACLTDVGQTEAAQKGGRLAGLTVMWVEDDTFLNDILSRKMTSEGCTPMNALNAEEALRLLEKQIPDVILLDLILPGMSGFEFLEKIRQDDRWKDIPVIIFSNLGQESDIQRAEQLGVVKHFVKAEMDVGEVVGEIADLFEGKR